MQKIYMTVLFLKRQNVFFYFRFDLKYSN